MEDMFYAVVNAIKELDNIITSLRNKEVKDLQIEVKNLKKENQELIKRIEALEKKIK